jgi:hypothetical protein
LGTGSKIVALLNPYVTLTKSVTLSSKEYGYALSKLQQEITFHWASSRVHSLDAALESNRVAVYSACIIHCRWNNPVCGSGGCSALRFVAAVMDIRNRIQKLSDTVLAALLIWGVVYLLLRGAQQNQRSKRFLILSPVFVIVIAGLAWYSESQGAEKLRKSQETDRIKQCELGREDA